MRKTNLVVALACTGLLTGLALPAAAATATTYHGSWTSVENCDGEMEIEPGNWNVMIGRDDKAEVSVAIFYEQGGLHAAWGGSYFISGKFVQNDPGDGYVFDVTSGNKNLVLDEQGQLTYSITDYPCSTGPKTVFVYGELDH
jgi:hypothetical protein